MDERQADTVRKLTDVILKEYDPEMVILFGSVARGDSDEFSDIDMLVVMDDDSPEETALKIMADTDPICTEKDIKIIAPGEYYRQKDIPGTILYPVLNEGEVIFKRPGFNKDVKPIEKYGDRKRGIIRKEFIEQSLDFLEKAGEALENNNMFRLRDYSRFAVIRALKAIFVFKDIHPPRETDLDLLLEALAGLHPVTVELMPTINRLKKFYPGIDGKSSDNPNEVRDAAAYIVNAIKEAVEPAA